MLDLAGQYLAQAGPVAPTGGFGFDAWIGQIAQYGLLGVMFLLVGYVLYKRDNDLTAERAARLADAKALLESIKADTEAKAAATASREATNRLMETLIKNQEAMTSKMDVVFSCVKDKP